MSRILTGDIEDMARICAELTRNGATYRATCDGYVWVIEITGTDSEGK